MQSFILIAELKVEVSAFYRSDTSQSFVEKIRTPRVDVCSLINNSADNFLVKQMSDYVEKLAPGLIHPCPYDGVLFIRVFLINKIFQL